LDALMASVFDIVAVDVPVVLAVPRVMVGAGGASSVALATGDGGVF
jgi:hypothetical protein